MALKLRDKHKISVAIAIATAFFFGELAVAYKTGSLALMADAFHYLSDTVGFGVTLTSILISEKIQYRQDFSFGWQRARLVGAFFNGAFLLALGLSILLQSIERFVSLRKVEDPTLILIMGGIGFGLNLITGAFLHEYQHDQHQGQHQDQHVHHGQYHGDPESQISLGTALSSICLHQDHNEADCPLKLNPHAGHRHAAHVIQGPGRDLGMLGALLHAVFDAISNLGVIVAGLIIWLTTWSGRFYFDPAIGLAISILILCSSIPFVKRSGIILLQSAPRGVVLDDIKHDIENIPGIISVHELHVWRLDQTKAVASAHIVVSDPDMASFMAKARRIRECLHAYGIHSATLQPELLLPSPSSPLALPGGPGPEAGAARWSTSAAAAIDAGRAAPGCQILCGKGMCSHLMCCGEPVQA